MQLKTVKIEKPDDTNLDSRPDACGSSQSDCPQMSPRASLPSPQATKKPPAIFRRPGAASVTGATGDDRRAQLVFPAH